MSQRSLEQPGAACRAGSEMGLSLSSDVVPGCFVALETFATSQRSSDDELGNVAEPALSQFGRVILCLFRMW